MLTPREEAVRPSLVSLGAVVAERYRVDARLGEGGMGTVYLAEHVHIRKRVALKVLLPHFTSKPEVVARFEQEAVAAGAVAHPNVAAATDFGRLGDGSFFLVLEYLEGRTLRTEIDKGALSPPRALAIARGIALGIAAAHAQGIVHRDLKPENVMLVTRDGDPDFVKVLDFGIARLEDRPTPTGEALTSAGMILGTPAYMAPEQALGAKVDHRADLYALGVILFEMLTGACPFRGEAVTLVRQHILNPAPPLPPHVAEAVPTEVRAIVSRLLAKEADSRYASAIELVPILDQCITALRPGDGARSPHQRFADGVRRAMKWGMARGVAGAARARGLWEGRRSTALPIGARPMRERVAHIAAGASALATHGVRGLWAAARRKPRIVIALALAVVASFIVLASRGSRATPLPAVLARPAKPLTTVAPAAPALAGSAPTGKDSSLSCLDAQFGARVEQGHPVGDVAEITLARKVIYWVDLANAGKPTQVTLVWKLDGSEVQRQSLSVGRAPHWRTWGAHALNGARRVDAQILDSSGAVLREDSLSLDE